MKFSKRMNRFGDEIFAVCPFQSGIPPMAFDLCFVKIFGGCRFGAEVDAVVGCVIISHAALRRNAAAQKGWTKQIDRI